jgi:hypothetical protein
MRWHSGVCCWSSGPAVKALLLSDTVHCCCLALTSAYTPLATSPWHSRPVQQAKRPSHTAPNPSTLLVRVGVPVLQVGLSDSPTEWRAPTYSWSGSLLRSSRICMLACIECMGRQQGTDQNADALMP